MRLPGGAGRTAGAGHVRRGVGFAVAIKNLMYSEGFDDYSTARCRLADGVASLKFATAEVGQGFVTIAQQIARTVLGVDEVVLEPMDTSIGSAGSTSASRQTWMSGGAVDAACRAVRERLFEHVGRLHDVDPLRLVIEDTDVVDTIGAAAGAGRRGDGRAAVRRDRRVPPSPHRRPRRERSGRLPHGVRLRRPPGRRRRRPRARPREGGADRDGPGRRAGPQPAVGARSDRGRHRPRPRARGDGGDRHRGWPDPEPVVHRLPAAHGTRRPTRSSPPSWRSPIRRRRSAPRAWASRRASR